MRTNLQPGYYAYEAEALGCILRDTICILSRGLDSVQTPLTGTGRSTSPLALQNGSQDGDILQWNQTAGNWEIAQPANSGGSSNIGNQTPGGDIVLTPDPNKGVAIGTTNPTARFQVMSAGTAKDAVRFCASDPTTNKTEIKVRETHVGQLRMEVKDSSGQTVVQLHSDGANYFNNGSNFGIGIPNPSAQFDVRPAGDGKVMQIRRSTGGQSLFEVNEFQGNAWLRMHDANGDRAFSFRTDGNSYINTDYKFGIGTTTPGAQFEVGSSGTNNTAFKVSPSQTGWQRGFEVKEQQTGELELNLFDTNNDQQVRIAGEESYFNGRVGIGTASPEAPLHTVGDLIFDALPIYDPADGPISGDIKRLPDGRIVELPTSPANCFDENGYSEWLLGGNQVPTSANCELGTKETLGSGRFQIIADGLDCIQLESIANIGKTRTRIVSSDIELQGVVRAFQAIGIKTNSPSAELDVNGIARVQGKLGIGTTLPQSELQVEGNGVISQRLGVGTDNLVADLTVDGNTHISGRLGIGVTNPQTALVVDGTICSKEVRVALPGMDQVCGSWPDFVFAEDYDLPNLTDVEAFIKTNHHLPGMPSAAEVEASGQELGDIQRKLLQKVEELTLYTIELKKENLEMKKQIDLLNQQVTPPTK